MTLLVSLGKVETWPPELLKFPQVVITCRQRVRASTLGNKSAPERPFRADAPGASMSPVLDAVALAGS